MQIHAVRLEKPDEVNLILGQSHFIKTVEDLHEALVGAVPGVQFGLAFNRGLRPGAGALQRHRPALMAQAEATPSDRGRPRLPDPAR